MIPPGKLSQSISELIALVHAERWEQSAKLVGELSRVDLKKMDLADPKQSVPIVQSMLHYLLNNGGMEEAAQLLWSPTVFDPRPTSTREVWQLFDVAPFFLIMGAGSMSKSYTMGVRLMLEWLRDPAHTAVRVVGPSEEHLQGNLFSHLVSLHRASKLPMPGEVGDLFIGLDRRDRTSSSICGVIIPVGNNKRAGRLQGLKRKPRKHAHPIFGALSRLFVFLDEAEIVPGGVWSDVDNLMSTFSLEDIAGLRIGGAYNPADPSSEVAKRAEPVDGWESFDMDRDYRWKSRRGWDVLRLDAHRCENVIEGRTVYPGLQTREGLEQIAKNAGGKTASGFYTFGRGAYPPKGTEMAVIPSGLLETWRGEPIWYDTPSPAGACDLALDGGAASLFTAGKFGLASGYKQSPTVQFPKGREVLFKDRNGQVVPRYLAFVEAQFPLPQGDTREMTDSILKTVRTLGVRPEFFCVDRTGHGAGIADLLKHEFSPLLHDLNYTDGASKAKLMAEDAKECCDLYYRAVSELWFAARYWLEFKYCLVAPGLDTGKLKSQLAQRRFSMSAGKNKVESKKDYMSRTSEPSPDEADSFTLFIHGIRKGSGFIPSMVGDNALLEDDSWLDSYRPEREQRLDCTMRPDLLEA